MSFVHDDREFDALLQIVAAGAGLGVALVEKDYWVTHTLWALQARGFDVWFKGGTSLSKGFALIQRFSEDLDLKIEPGSVSTVRPVTSWTSEGTTAKAERQAHFEELFAALNVPGATLTLAPGGDTKFRSTSPRRISRQVRGDSGPGDVAFRVARDWQRAGNPSDPSRHDVVRSYSPRVDEAARRLR